jgi:hypothetical protein
MAEAVNPSSPVGGRSRHAHKFSLLIGLLAGVAIGAIALAAVLIAGGRSAGSGGWSAWRPGDDGAAGAQEIANHVGPQYRLPDGSQLASITGGALKIANLPAHIAQAAPNGAISIVDGSTVLFTLCGDGPKCSIPGTPTVERGELVHREALELALYAFHYLKVDNVVALMPPSYVPPKAKSATSKPVKVKVKAQSTALLLHRDQLGSAIHDPLDMTLSSPPPSVKTVDSLPETQLVNEVMQGSLFGMRLVQAQDATAVVLLEPLTK